METRYKKQNVLADIEKENILKNWLALFPERKQKKDVEQIVESISNRKLQDFLEGYEKEKNVVEQIQNLFADLEQYRCKPMVDEICKKIYSENRWVYFYAPILYRNVESIMDTIYASEILSDVERLLWKVLTDITDKLSGQSYRVLVRRLNAATKQNKLLGKSEKERGKYFSDVLLRDEEYLLELYLDYPELYNVMNRTVQYNLQYVVEIISNTEYAFNQIRTRLGKNSVLGKLEYIRLGSGDSHNNGKTVAALIFEDGQKLMYKPRSLKMEQSYCDFIDWINRTVPVSTGLDYCKVYSLENAGWVEYVENDECKTEEEIREFYRKTGELLCILYTLSSKDFHCENLIARGKQPILIDMETLIHVEAIGEQRERDAIEEKISQFINSSVYSTALLPTTLQNYNTDNSMEIGGICSGRKRISPFKAHVLKNAGTDKVTIENEYREVPLNQNLPVYKGDKIGAIGYFEYIKDSFTQMYKWIENHKEEYINKIYEIYGEVECRVIYKTTNNYTQLLATSYHPSLLHNEVDREIYFHRIGLLYDGKESLSVLYRDEINAMMNGDVPVYLMKSMGRHTYNADGKIINKDYKKTPLNRVEEKVRSMSELDYKRQLALIYYSFIGCEMKTDKESKTDVSFAETMRSKAKYDFVEEAKKIAGHIMTRSFSDTIKGRTQISWFGFQGMGQQGYAITPVGWDMYKGNCGIALFFFQLAEVTKEESYRLCAKDILQSVEETLRSAAREDYKAIGIGAFTGVTSYLYTYYKMLQYNWISECEKHKKIEIVEHIVDYVDSAIYETDRVDVLTGIAGVMGVLVSLYPYTKGRISEKILKIIQNISDILLERRIRVDETKVTWFENHDIGYVHGNTGIIAHLARANTILNRSDIKKVIMQTLQYEREDSYDEKSKRWILRANAHYFSWCNGIAGMLFGKIMLKKAGIKDLQLDREIKEMAKQLVETGFGLDACLCHGDMGSLCALRYVADYVDDDVMKTGCHNTCMDLLEKKVKTGDIFVLEDWGLMTGAAGIGLGLLEQSGKEPFLASIMSLL